MAYKSSRNGYLFTLCREAIVTVAYADGPKYKSIGVGHNGPEVGADDVLTVPHAFDLFVKDMAKLDARLNRELKVPVLQPQYDALKDLNFNAGNRYVWDVVKLINAGEMDAAADTMLRDDQNLSGEHIPGLSKRRALEVAMFSHGDYGHLDRVLLFTGNPRTTRPQTYVVQDADFAEAA